MEPPLTPNSSRRLSKFPFEEDTEPQRFSNRIADILINTRCDRKAKFALSVSLGVIAVIMQLPPLIFEWVIINEPKNVNQTNEKGEHIDVIFNYHVGYFGMCRLLTENITAYGVDTERVESEFPELCVLNPFYTGDDLSDFSFASNVILARLGIPGVLHIPGVFLCVLAVIYSILGETKNDNKTLRSAIFYVIGGLCLFAAVLQLIAAVDDEMAPRMKPNAAGDPSPFSYYYSKSFISASLSFLPLQICVYLQVTAFFARYPLPIDKAWIVPGLMDMISEIIARSRRGVPNVSSSSAPLSANSFRRESRSSRDFSTPAFGAVQQEIPRLAPPLTENVHRHSIHVYI